LEKDLDDLANGIALTGEGVGAAPSTGAADAAPAIPEGFSEMNAADISKETVAIGTVLEGFTKNDALKEMATGCPRAFCVVVLQENFYPNTGKTLFKYENYRVVVGPKENIDKMKELFENEVKGSFTPIIRE